MQHRLELAHGDLLPEDRGDVVVRVARVDHERQSQLARHGDLAAKHARCDVTRSVIVVIVETRLADADAFGMRGEGANRYGVDLRLLGHLMRMSAYREVNIWKSFRD